MARNETRDRRNERKSDRRKKSYSGLNLREAARSRPIAAAAVATAAAAAGAYFLSRRSGGSDETRPLMNWGRKDQEQDQDQTGARGSSRTQGSTSSDPMLETASTTPSAAAGTSSTGSSPRKAPSSSSGSTQPASDTGSQTSPPGGNTGLDQTSKSDLKVGSVSY